MQTDTCPRDRADCAPICNIISEDDVSFICAGFNLPKDRVVPGDRFTTCFKNPMIDERTHSDRRDLIDTVMVYSTALSTDENIRVGQGISEDEMNEMELF